MADAYFHTLPPGMDDALFFRRLERLRIAALRRARGGSGSDRIVRRTGGSVEFAGHRSYERGDDLRYLDWHLLARLDSPYTKTYHEQEYYHVHLLLDSSASMAGMQEERKLHLAQDAATALGYLVLAGEDRLRLVRFPGRDGAPFTHAGPHFLLGVRQMPSVRRFVGNTYAEGAADMPAAFARYAHQYRRRLDVVIVVSDFLIETSSLRRALNAFVQTRCHLVLIRVVDALERTLRPDNTRVRVRDVETGRERTPTLDEAGRRRYEALFEEHRAALRLFCRAHDIRLAELDTGGRWYDPYREDSLLARLQHLAILRPG